MAKKNLIHIVGLLLLMAGLSLLVKGSWISLKAELAAVLLRHSWEQSQAAGQAVRPWPWADTWPVGRLLCARLGIDSIILEGASGAALAFGPGHFLRSGKVGGDAHTIIAGHRDTSFAFLAHLHTGDNLVLEGGDGCRSYRVEHIQVLSARTLNLDPSVPGRLTLITCYPFDSLLPNTPLRYVVTCAELYKDKQV